jgi:transcriptional regulator GlxA family with amidase domain
MAQTDASNASGGAEQTLALALLLFNDIEVLDFCGPYEVFTMASRLAVDDDPSLPPPFSIFTVAQDAGVITASGGLCVQPTYTFADHPQIDVLIVPGGLGTHKELGNARLIDWIATVAAADLVTTSVCTGALLLAQAGVLDGHQATTHWASVDRLAADYPAVAVRRDVRWVDDGQVVTSAGIAAGIDMSLHLVQRVAGRELASHTAHRMQYPWMPD